MEEGGVAMPQADRLFRSIGPWRGLADTNLQQIISTRRRIPMRKLAENTDGGRSANTARNMWAGALCLHRTGGPRLHDFRYDPPSYGSR